MQVRDRPRDGDGRNAGRARGDGEVAGGPLAPDSPRGGENEGRGGAAAVQQDVRREAGGHREEAR